MGLSFNSGVEGPERVAKREITAGSFKQGGGAVAVQNNTMGLLF
jgi:hypothetical protein